MSPIDPFLQNTRIAYFSMEIALRAEIHTYSGGLGVLAGDTVRSAADLELPMVFVTLVSRAGHFYQMIDDHGRQEEHEDPWNPDDWATPLPAMIALPLEGREVWVRPWLHIYASAAGHKIPILFLDTDLEENRSDDRMLTHYLYGGDPAYRIKQELVLGAAGIRLLRALGFLIDTYHMNEGHPAFLAAELLNRFRLPPAKMIEQEYEYDTARVRSLCVFTTHTPVDAGHDRFSYDLVESVAGESFDIRALKRAGGGENLNMTQLALSLSGYVNGVARRHAETTGQMYPGIHIRAITNGIHVGNWAHESFARLYDSNFDSWAHEPELLARADQLSDSAVWDAHTTAKSQMLTEIERSTGMRMDPAIPLVAFARRMTGYKRPALLFANITRLQTIAKQTPFQIVIAGKAHPDDTDGKRLIEQIHKDMRALSGTIKCVYLPNYDFRLAKMMVAGSDIWLNTPQPPLEASGTSGMKAALNGVLNLSILDGWWLEACIEGVTGWAIESAGVPAQDDADAEGLYQKLGNTVLPLYYEDRSRWIWMMKQGISKIASYFNSQRMMRRYASEAYLR